MNRPAMVQLLLDLGADPLAVDGAGMPVAGYATTPDIDLPVMQKIRAMTFAEFDSAARGHRPPNVGVMDVLAAVALRDLETASAIIAANRKVIDHGGALHLLAKRGDATGVIWLLERGANPNALWAHWGADLTALHLAAFSGATDVARVLLDAGADPHIRDSQHDSDALGWAGFFKTAGDRATPEHSRQSMTLSAARSRKAPDPNDFDGPGVLCEARCASTSSISSACFAARQRAPPLRSSRWP